MYIRDCHSFIYFPLFCILVYLYIHIYYIYIYACVCTRVCNVYTLVHMSGEPMNFAREKSIFYYHNTSSSNYSNFVLFLPFKIFSRNFSMSTAILLRYTPDLLSWNFCAFNESRVVRLKEKKFRKRCIYV